MKPDIASFQIVGHGERAACAVAGLTCSAGIFGALVLCLNSASPDTWLLPTPELTASMARCDEQRSRLAHTQCRKRVVAMNLAADSQFAQLAKH